MVSDLNLLPPSRRQALAKQYVVADVHRFLASITMSLLLLTLAGGVSLGVLQSLISASSAAKFAQLELVMSQYAALRESVAAQNTVLSEMKQAVESRLLWGDKTYELLTLIPGGVRIQSMKGSGSDTPSLSFSGQAATRNSLIILEQRLRALSWAVSIDAPNSNLIDRTNAPYEFIISLK